MVQKDPPLRRHCHLIHRRSLARGELQSIILFIGDRWLEVSSIDDVARKDCLLKPRRATAARELQGWLKA